MKRFLIECWTHWCGEEETYVAIAKNEGELLDLASLLAYDNFMEGMGSDGMYREEYPDIDLEDLTEEDIEAVDESGYYGVSITEWDETRPEEEWDWYELVYDANENDEEDNNGEV